MIYTRNAANSMRLTIAILGNTQVTERVLENQVAQGVLVDVCGIPYDLSLWIKNRLPAKLEILRNLQAAYPDVFDDDEEVMEGMSRDKFIEIISQSKTIEEEQLPNFVRKFHQVSKFNVEKAAKSGAELIYDHYLRFHVLHLFPAEATNQAEGATFWRRRLNAPETMQRNANSSGQFLNSRQNFDRQSSRPRGARAGGGLLALLPHRANQYSASREDVMSSLDSLAS